MPKILIIGNEEFEFPLENENGNYGSSVTDWAESVTDALTTVQQPNDVLRTQAPISNNVAVFTNIPGFSFDTSEVMSVNSEFIIKRTTATPATNLVESGFIQGNFDGTDWKISIETTGANSGVEFEITPAGQVRYKSSNIVGAGYEGTVTFRARVFNQD